MRQLSPAEIAIKAATWQSIRKAGGVEAVAEFVRVGKSALAAYYSLNHPDSFIPADVAALVDELAGFPFITNAMQAALSPSTGKRQCFHKLLSAFLKEAGEVGSVMSDSLADGEISPREAADIIKEAQDGQAALQKIIDSASDAQAAAVQARKEKVMA